VGKLYVVTVRCARRNERICRTPALHVAFIEKIAHFRAGSAWLCQHGRHDVVRCPPQEIPNERAADGGDLLLAIGQLIEPPGIDRLRRGQDEFHRVDTDGNHVVAELLGACSFPMAERDLFAELMGNGPSRAHVQAYAEFLANALLTGLMRTPEKS